MHPLHLRQKKGLKKYGFGFEGYISKAEEGAGFSEGQGGGGAKGLNSQRELDS